MIWGVALAAVSGSVFGLIILVKNSKSLNQFGSLVVPVTEADRSKGPANAESVLVEYSDFQCPACKNYYPILKQLNEEFGGKLKFVYRHFPLSQIHANAKLAAYAAEAAGEQGKFWEMHDWLFEHQDDWAKKSAGETANDFISFTQSLGLDEEKFKKDLDSEEIKRMVDESYNGGIGAGVNSTPTFFLNGKKLVQPRSSEEFKKVINDSINADP